MRVILHIGMHKTGTTALQKLLHRKRKSLLSKGIYYPDAALLDRHSILAVPMMNSKLPREFWRIFGRDQVEAASESADRIWVDIAANTAKEKPEILILSGETFFDIHDFQGLKERISRFGAEAVSIACYLRDPYEKYPSALQQVVKVSSKLPASLYKPVTDQMKKFQDIGDLSIREYNKHTLVEGDIVSDFFSFFLDENISPPPIAQNEGFSAEGASLLQDYRRKYFPKEDGVSFPESVRFLSALRRAEFLLGGRRYFGKPKLIKGVAEGILFESKSDLEALEKDFNFIFLDKGNARLSERRFDYRSNLNVRDVLQVDESRLLALKEKVNEVLSTKSEIG